MTLTHTTDHNNQAKARFIQQFKGKVNLDNVMDALVDQVQDIEDANYQLITDRTIDVAVGEQLDGIGQLVGELRLGKSDASYRTYLKVRMLINVGHGRTEELYAMLIQLLGDIYDIEIQQFYPCSITIIFNNLYTASTVDILRIIDQAKAAGVQVFLEYFTTEPVFSFDGDTGNVSTFGDSTVPATGGYFASVEIP